MIGQFIFVLGSNWKLSLAEIDACLKSKTFKGKIADYSSNIAIVEFDSLLNEKYYIDKLETLQYYLGGTQKIAKVSDFINIFTLEKAFPLRIENFHEVEENRKKIENKLDNFIEDTFPKIEGKNTFFAVSIYPNLFDDIYYKDILAKHFLPFLNKRISSILKEKKANKAIYFRYPEKNINTGNLNPIFPHHVIKYELFKENRAELIFGITEEGAYMGRTFTADDPNFKRKIDEERPHKDFKSSISPKLAIIMSNFLNIFQNRNTKKILDPFVGNGIIVLFAILEDFQVYGSDIDNNKVRNTIENIRWFQRELDLPPIPDLEKRFRVSTIENLTKSFNQNFFDGIITEPDLGPFYKKQPYFLEVNEILNKKIQPLYEKLFKQSYKILKSNGRICLIAPSISVVDDTKDIRLNIENLATSHNFKKIPLISSKRITEKSNKILQFRKKKLFSILDTKENQIVKRKLYVFEKK